MQTVPAEWFIVMTYIEFFDKVASENICACLSYAPECVIYIGGNAKLMKKHIANYQKIFSARNVDIEFLYRTVSKSNLDNSVALLCEIVESYDDCVFDITGGEEILTLALGIVYEKYPDKNIQIHKFNLQNNMIYDCDKDGTTIYKDAPALSAEENVRIYGGDIVYGGVDEELTYRWDLNSEFLLDVNLMWDVCRGNVRYWNMQMCILEAAEKVGVISEDGLTTTVSRMALEHYLTIHKAKYKKAKGIINSLIRCGLLICFDDENEDVLTISYKNKQIKRCLTKAGQALEMKIYVTVKSILDHDGVPVYNDVLNGVVIDWDGEFHDEKTENLYDTENEIDVFLMHGIVPVFVSCKNGIVTSDELYKLNTVAERFGGRYSQKVLITTALNSLGEAGEYLRQRAADMNIKLIENIQNLSDDELARKLRNLWNN